MKKILCVFLSVLLLVPFCVSAQAEQTSGTLKMLAYNVSGIPLVGNFQGSVFTLTNDRAAKIGALLNGTDADFISVEEDFNAHRYLDAEMNAFPYRSFTSGGLALGQGLNIFSRRGIYNVRRIKWLEHFGTVSGSADALANKGFLYCLAEIADGVYIHVITVHCDAGYEPLSVRARAAQFRQLALFINEELDDGRAIIVQGDFNFKFKREKKDDLVGNLLKPTGLIDVWAELAGSALDTADPAFARDAEGDELDRVLYRSGRDVTLTPLSRTEPPLTGENGETYTDHDPMLVEFAYTVGEPVEAPLLLVEPLPEDPVRLVLREILWTVARIFQAVFGIIELPYLIYQGVDLLVNGKLP